MGKKRFIGILVVCALLLMASVSEATIRNRGVGKKADIDLGKINIEADPNEHRAASAGYNQFMQMPTVLNANQITPAAGFNGAIWYDATNDLLEACIGGAKVDIGASASTETLDLAYTAGNTITVDGSGNVEIDLSLTAKMVEIANTFNGAQAVALTIDNESAGTNAIVDGILFSTSGATATITDAIDAKDAGITNAINVGPNVIYGTGGASINFDEFDVASGTGNVTINDDGDLGVFTVEGTALDINSLTFVGAGEIKSTGTALTLTADNAGTGDDLIITADNLALTAVGLMTFSPDAALDTAINLTATNIDHAIKIGDNTIDGDAAAIEFTYFSVDAAGAVVCTALDAGTGDITTTGDLDVGQILESAVAPSSGNLSVNAAAGANTVNIGNVSTGGIVMGDDVDFDVTSGFSGTAGLFFNTGGTEQINSSTADQLDIDAAVEIEMATTILDINLTDNSDILVTGTDKSFTIATTDGDVILSAVGGSNGDIIIGAGDDIEIDAVGVIELNSSGGIISIGSDAIAQAVNVGTGSAARIVTVGNIASTETQIDGLLVDINAGSSGLTMDAGAAANLTTSAGDVTIQATAASVNINANETAADQIKLNAQGAISGNAINLLTTNGGITLHANGANGVISIDAAGNLTLATTTSGTLAISSAGVVDIDATYSNAITINTAADSTGDDVDIADITITTGAKGAGTGDGGDIILIAGDTTGGTQGYIKIQDDILVQTTEKIYFNDTGTFVNSPSNGKIEIEADGGGADDILLDGGVTVGAGHDVTMGTGHVIGAGDSEIDGFRLDLVAATATTITAAQSGNVFYNTGAVQIELPEAGASLGCYYTFVVDNAANFDINPDDADHIVGLTNTAGDMIRSGTLGDTITLVAVTAVNWYVIGSSNTNASADAWTDAD